MKFIDLFAGVGGFRIALERLGLECVWSCEINKYCEIIYNKNFGSGYDERDIREVDTSTITEHDIICGGFPCQPFSVAGKRKGLNEDRGTLFDEIIRIAKDKRTPYLFLENVKGLLSAQDGYAFWHILNSLDELGYDAQWQVLNSKYFGVPQNRERVFIIANLRNKTQPKVFPIFGTMPKANISKTIRTGGKKSLDKKHTRDLIQVGHIDTDRMGQRVYDFNGIATTIRAEGGGWGAKTGLYIQTPPHGYYKGGKKQYPNLRANSGSPSNEILNGIRRLTPLECERLQGFPDNWTLHKDVSDTQRYKMMGNAVTVNVIEAIAKKWFDTDQKVSAGGT